MYTEKEGMRKGKKLMKNSRKRDSKKKSGILFRIIVILLICIIVFCLWRVVPYLWNTHKSNSDYAKLAGEVVREKDPGKTPGASGSHKGNGDSGAVWKNTGVDFQKLHRINPDIRAWLRFDHTDTVPIDYPVLYSGDNNAYLHTNIYKNYAFAGCLFLEETNTPEWQSEKDMSKIIYGHNMNNGSMFGSLKKYRRENIYGDNRYFTLYTPKAAYRYRIFSYFNTYTGSFVYRTGYTKGSKEYKAYLKELSSHSMKNTGITPTGKTPVLVLSTCVQHGTSVRFVVCGELAEKRIYKS